MCEFVAPKVNVVLMMDAIKEQSNSEFSVQLSKDEGNTILGVFEAVHRLNNDWHGRMVLNDDEIFAVYEGTSWSRSLWSSIPVGHEGIVKFGTVYDISGIPKLDTKD